MELIVIGLYLLLAPIIFFLISNHKHANLRSKVGQLEKELANLRGQAPSPRNQPAQSYYQPDPPVLEPNRQVNPTGLRPNQPNLWPANQAGQSMMPTSPAYTSQVGPNPIYSNQARPNPTYRPNQANASQPYPHQVGPNPAYANQASPNPAYRAQAHFHPAYPNQAGPQVSQTNPVKAQPSLMDKIKANLNAESIIGKLGALLLLVGIGFVFKFAYDNGYIDHKATLAIGFALSAILVGLGLYFVKNQRPVLAQILIGTGFAASYITTYAGYLYYGNLSNVLAFFILAFINLLIFAISYLYHFETVIVLANITSISVPFLVDMEFLGITGFGLYLVSLSFLSMLIYSLKGWHLLQVVNTLLTMLSLLLLGTLNGAPIDLSLFSYLVIVQSLILLLPDICLHLLGRNKAFLKDRDFCLKEMVIQTLVFAFTFFMLFAIDIFSAKTIAYIMLGYGLIYGAAAYILWQKAKSAYFMQALYSLASISALISLSIQFADWHLGLFLLGLTLVLTWCDQYIQSRLSAFVAMAVYGLSLVLTLFDLFIYEKLSTMSIILLVTLAFMLIIDRFLRPAYKKIYRLISYQVYISIFINLAMYNLYAGDSDDFNIFFLQLLVVNSLLLAIYEGVKYKFNIFDEKHSLGVFLGLTGIYSLGLAFDMVNYALYSYLWADDLYHKFSLGEMSISFLVAVLILLLAKSARQKTSIYLYKMAGMLILQVFALIQVAYYFQDFRYGVLLSSLLVLAYHIYNQKYAKEVQTSDRRLLRICQFFSIGVNLLFFIWIYPEYYVNDHLDFWAILLNTITMKLFYNNLRSFIANKYATYTLASLMVIYLSYVHIYHPTGGNHYVSLIWATYVIIRFILYVRKSDLKMANTCIASLVVIVAKFVLIDLHSASTLSKVVTSMGFGIVLLVLSYMMPKIIGNLSKPAKEDKNQPNTIEKSE